MEKRELGKNVTLENRALSHERVNKDIRKQQILKVLEDAHTGMTVREIAYELFVRNIVDFFERNNVAPRITELCQEGILEPIGTDIDQWTGRDVTVFYFTKEVKENNFNTKYTRD